MSDTSRDPFSPLVDDVRALLLRHAVTLIPLRFGGGLRIRLLESLALDPVMAVTTGVILRVREFVWIAAGLLFVLFSHEKGKNGRGGGEARFPGNFDNLSIYD